MCRSRSSSSISRGEFHGVRFDQPQEIMVMPSPRSTSRSSGSVTIADWPIISRSSGGSSLPVIT
jgi:hypothetical protein